jgi:hypothetical protein
MGTPRRTNAGPAIVILVSIALLVATACVDDAIDLTSPTETSSSSPTTSGPAVTTAPSTTTAPAGTTATTTTTTTLAETCSAAGMALTLPAEPGLPDPVAQMRVRVTDAALSCSFDRLAALGVEGGFSWSFNPDLEAGPAAFWREMETYGTMPMRRLLELFELPVGVMDIAGTDVFMWPSVAAYDDWASAPEADREALRSLFTDEDMELFAAENVYLGSRVAIDEDGDWLWYVAGD